MSRLTLIKAINTKIFYYWLATIPQSKRHIAIREKPILANVAKLFQTGFTSYREA